MLRSYPAPWGGVVDSKSLNMVKKNVTTDELAAMINSGFNAVDKHFDIVDKRFDALEVNAREVDSQLSRIGREVSEIHRHLVYRDEFDDLMDRVKYVESKLGIESGK